MSHEATRKTFGSPRTHVAEAATVLWRLSLAQGDVRRTEQECRRALAVGATALEFIAAGRASNRGNSIHRAAHRSRRYELAERLRELEAGLDVTPDMYRRHL